MRWRLLPPDEEWVQYAWLVYLPSVFLGPIVAHASLSAWAITIAGALAFHALYFRAHWVSETQVVWYIAAMTLLGVVYSPINNGAIVYFIIATARGRQPGGGGPAGAGQGLVVNHLPGSG